MAVLKPEPIQCDNFRPGQFVCETTAHRLKSLLLAADRSRTRAVRLHFLLCCQEFVARLFDTIFELCQFNFALLGHFTRDTFGGGFCRAAHELCATKWLTTIVAKVETEFIHHFQNLVIGKVVASLKLFLAFALLTSCLHAAKDRVVHAFCKFGWRFVAGVVVGNAEESVGHFRDHGFARPTSSP